MSAVAPPVKKMNISASNSTFHVKQVTLQKKSPQHPVTKQLIAPLKVSKPILVHRSDVRPTTVTSSSLAINQQIKTIPSKPEIIKTPVISLSELSSNAAPNNTSSHVIQSAIPTTLSSLPVTASHVISTLCHQQCKSLKVCLPDATQLQSPVTATPTIIMEGANKTGMTSSQGVVPVIDNSLSQANNCGISLSVQKSSGKGRKRGCRCGLATPNPGKLTCCGQRCPCYVDGKGCFDCKCRGCRNPHRANTNSGITVAPAVKVVRPVEGKTNNNDNNQIVRTSNCHQLDSPAIPTKRSVCLASGSFMPPGVTAVNLISLPVGLTHNSQGILIGPNLTIAPTTCTPTSGSNSFSFANAVPTSMLNPSSDPLTLPSLEEIDHDVTKMSFPIVTNQADL
jgi:hypothetical protein